MNKEIIGVNSYGVISSVKWGLKGLPKSEPGTVTEVLRPVDTQIERDNGNNNCLYEKLEFKNGNTVVVGSNPDDFPAMETIPNKKIINVAGDFREDIGSVQIRNQQLSQEVKEDGTTAFTLRLDESNDFLYFNTDNQGHTKATSYYDAINNKYAEEIPYDVNKLDDGSYQISHTSKMHTLIHVVRPFVPWDFINEKKAQ